MSLRIHYHSDCDTFAGCEQMLVVLLRWAARSPDVSPTFTYRWSHEYAAGVTRRLPPETPADGRFLPDVGVLRSAIGRRCRGRLGIALKYATYALPIRQAFQVVDIILLLPILRRERPDIVHINNGGFPGAASANAAVLAARLARVPAIVYVVNNMATDYRSPVRWFDYPLDRLVGCSVTRFVTGSTAARTALQTVLGTCKVDVVSIHNGIVEREPDQSPHHVRNDLGLDAETVILAVVARLEARKGHRHLIRAFSTLVGLPQTPPCVLIIEGQGPEEGSLRRLVSSLGIGNRVRFVGEMANVWNLLHVADVVVLPSTTHEDFPNVVLEAMAAGKAVVASDVGGTSEQLVNGSTGLLVEPGDTKALAVALGTVVVDADTRVRMGTAGRSRFLEHFSESAASERYRRLYAELVSGQKRGQATRGP